MLGLLLETSTEKGLIALAENSAETTVKFLVGGPELSKTLAFEVKKILGLSKPDYIAVGTGPGSYTGIRVGAALAKALGFGWQIPLFSFCSLQAFAPDESTPVLFDARMGGFYVLKHFQDKPRLLSLAAAEAELQNAPLLASPHPSLIQKRLMLSIPWIETSPDPGRLAQLAHTLYLAGDPASLTLSYLSAPY